MKRIGLLALAGAVLISLVGSEALAQNSPGVWRSTTRASGGAGKGRQAVQKPRVDPRAEPHVIIVPSQGGSLLNPVYRVPVVVVPAVLLFDGSIFANFGFGYEPIFQFCSSGATMGAVVASNGVVLHPAPASNYTRPVYSRLTRSDLLGTGLRVHDVIVSDFARLACFNSGANMVYVYR